MLRIFSLNAFKDNYMWVLEQNQSLMIVDPGQSHPIIEYAQQVCKPVKTILITHHHWDHTQGLRELIIHYPDVRVFASQQEGGIEGVTDFLLPNQQIQEQGIKIQTLDLSGHTQGHLGYYVPNLSLSHNQTQQGVMNYEIDEDFSCSQIGCVFTGDALFSMGCGRVFEGTSEQMVLALERLKSLPANTHVYAGHEYTLSNLKWARAVDPMNEQLFDYQQQMQEKRDQGLPTLPSTIGDQCRLNPFLRLDQSSIIKAVTAYCGRKPTSVIEVFEILRQWKNEF